VTSPIHDLYGPVRYFPLLRINIRAAGVEVIGPEKRVGPTKKAYDPAKSMRLN